MVLAKQTLCILMFRSVSSVQEVPYPELNESNFIFMFHLMPIVSISVRTKYFNLKNLENMSRLIQYTIKLLF